VVADSGTYELNNLNRQHATVGDIDRNKAEVAAERILAVNPHAEVAVHPEGVTAQNVRELTGTCDLVVDGVDVTTMSGLRAKYLLHEQAAARQLPLVTGWDMAGRLYAQYFDYRKINRPFDGALTAADLDRLGIWDLIFRMLPFKRIPSDMLAELNTNLGRRDYSVPQVVYAALLFGAITSHMAARILAGEEVREEINLDVHHAVRRTPERLSNLLRRPVEAARLRRALRSLRAVESLSSEVSGRAVT
jgi:tRNA threonylcarbamoyladenosine dehydratase